MRPQKQLYKHDPDNGSWGDCHRTCIAMILNMDAADVPHFCHPDNADWQKAEREWLTKRGLTAALVPYRGDKITLDTLCEQLSLTGGGAPVILGCQSSAGCNHSVVICDGEVFNPSDSTILGPSDDGYWWLTFISVGANYEAA